MEGQSEKKALSQATPIRGHVTLSFYATTGYQTTPNPSHKMKELTVVAYFDGKLTGVWKCSFETTKTSIFSKASPGPFPPYHPHKLILQLLVTSTRAAHSSTTGTTGQRVT